MRLILFDFDSTLISVESLDIAARLGLNGRPDQARRLGKIEAITRAAMEGRLAFDEALANRLALLDLDRATIARAADAVAETVTRGAPDLIAQLLARGDSVAIVSGGFEELIAKAAQNCGLGADALHGNRFVFDGDLATADPTRALAKPGGKIDMARRLRSRSGANSVVMIGDGATDLEAYEAGAADDFIAYTEHAAREAVISRAPKHATDMKGLARHLIGKN